MRIIYKVKDVLGMAAAGKGASSSPRAPAGSLAGTTTNSIHSTPPGDWPAEGPKKSKCSIVCYYVSVALTMIGTIIIVRSAFFLEEDEKPLALGVGLCMATGGIAMIAITNVLNKLEHERIMRYLERRVEELRYHENYGKMPNHQEARYLVPSEGSRA